MGNACASSFNSVYIPLSAVAMTALAGGCLYLMSRRSAANRRVAQLLAEKATTEQRHQKELADVKEQLADVKQQLAVANEQARRRGQPQQQQPAAERAGGDAAPVLGRRDAEAAFAAINQFFVHLQQNWAPAAGGQPAFRGLELQAAALAGLQRLHHYFQQQPLVQDQAQ